MSEPAENTRRRRAASGSSAGGVDAPVIAAARRAAELTQLRRRRSVVLATDALFGDPAWDMLLFLLTSEAQSRPVSVTAVASGAGLSLTTGLRWLDQLLAHGLAARRRDPRDGRRTFVVLTPAGRGMLVETLT